MSGGLIIIEGFGVSIITSYAKDFTDGLIKFFKNRQTEVENRKEIEQLLNNFYNQNVEHDLNVKINFDEFQKYITSQSFYENIFESFIGEKNIEDIKSKAGNAFASDDDCTDIFIDSLIQILRKSINNTIPYKEKYLAHTVIDEVTQVSKNNTIELVNKMERLEEVVKKLNTKDNVFADDMFEKISKNIRDWRINEAYGQISESMKDKESLSIEQQDKLLFYNSLVNYRLNRYNVVKKNVSKFEIKGTWYLKNEELICFIDKDFERFCDNLVEMKLSEDEQIIKKIMFRCFYKKEDVTTDICENFLKENVSSQIFEYRYINLLCAIYYEATDFTKALSYFEAEYNISQNGLDNLRARLYQCNQIFDEPNVDKVDKIYKELNDFLYMVSFLNKNMQITFWTCKLRLAELISYDYVIQTFNNIPIEILNEKDILFEVFDIFLKYDNSNAYLEILNGKVYDNNFYKYYIDFKTKIVLGRYAGVDELYAYCLEKYETESELIELINCMWYLYKSDIGLYEEVHDDIHNNICQIKIERYVLLLNIAVKNKDIELINKIIGVIKDITFNDLNYAKHIIENLIINNYLKEARLLSINYIGIDEKILEQHINTFEFEVLTNDKRNNPERTECLDNLNKIYKHGIRSRTLLYYLMLLELYDGCYSDVFIKISNEYKTLYGIDNQYTNLYFKFLSERSKLNININDEIDFALKSDNRNLKINLLNYFVKKQEYKEATDLFIDLIISMDKFDEFDEFIEQLLIIDLSLDAGIFNEGSDISIKTVKPDCVVKLGENYILIHKNKTKFSNNEELNCRYINEGHELAVLLKEKQVGQTIKYLDEEFEIKEILNFYEYFSGKLREFYFTKYQKLKNVDIIKIDIENDDVISKLTSSINKFDASEFNNDIINMYNATGLPLDKINKGFDYLNSLIFMANNKKILINGGKSSNNLCIDEDTKFVLSLHSIIYLHIAGVLEKLSFIREKIIIHVNIKEEILSYIQDAKFFEKEVSGTINFDEKGEVLFNDLKNNYKLKLSEFLEQLLSIINNFTIVGNESSVEHEKYKDRKNCLNSFDIDVFDITSSNDKYYFVSDSIGMSSLYEEINGEKRNITSLNLFLNLKLKPDLIKHYIEILIAFSKINYVFFIPKYFFETILQLANMSEDEYNYELINLLENLHNVFDSYDKNELYKKNDAILIQLISDIKSIIDNRKND